MQQTCLTSRVRIWSNCSTREQSINCQRWVAIVASHVPTYSNTSAPAMPNGNRLSENSPRYPNSTDSVIEHDLGCRAGCLRPLSGGATRPLYVARGRVCDPRVLDKPNPR